MDRGSAQYENIQLSIRLQFKNTGHKEDHIPVLRRPGRIHCPQSVLNATDISSPSGIQTSKSLWESRYIWLPITMDDKTKSLELEWHDVYDLDVKSGDWPSFEGKTYFSKDARISGNAFKEEANFASGGVIVTGIYSNDSSVTFYNVEGAGQPQWVSFYYQTGGTPDRIGGAWKLRRISSVIVNVSKRRAQGNHPVSISAADS
ncbi:hypothetical protein GGS21DRAFT_491834 [Xylaria nigripes]|nr:hypothetical protein GGS21DRAFT_491834 [Xylaria nigripes]